MIAAWGVVSLESPMTRLGQIMGVAAVLVCLSAPGAASADPHPAKPKKECKAAWVLHKGKCHRRKTRRPPPAKPVSLVRASLTWDGPANLWLEIRGSEGRAGFFSEQGVLNEIPNALFVRHGDPGGPGDETFTDNLFYGGYGWTYWPSPGNRNFTYTICDNPPDGTEPIHASLMTVGANGGVSQSSWTITPQPGPQPSGCATLIN
jgi:hypothetical protein